MILLRSPVATGEIKMVETKNLARVEAGRRNHMNGTTVEKIVK